ncbi:MAG: beta-lactamase family protein [Deltaproteobacteria bacterium]|nr:beta-lactamase family protein [Deltaproteobacteria bacterium]
MKQVDQMMKEAITDEVFPGGVLLLATTLAVMQLVSQHKLRLDQDLGSVLPRLYNSEKARITLKQLLCHTSGLCDYRPYYESLDKLPRNRRKDALREFLVSEPLINPPGTKVLYSDLGFMLLNWVVLLILTQSPGTCNLPLPSVVHGGTLL